MPEERPQPGTRCVVAACEEPATMFVDIAEGEPLEGETAVPMCDQHASHWRSAE